MAPNHPSLDYAQFKEFGYIIYAYNHRLKVLEGYVEKIKKYE